MKPVSEGAHSLVTGRKHGDPLKIAIFGALEGRNCVQLQIFARVIPFRLAGSGTDDDTNTSGQNREHLLKWSRPILLAKRGADIAVGVPK